MSDLTITYKILFEPAEKGKNPFYVLDPADDSREFELHERATAESCIELYTQTKKAWWNGTFRIVEHADGQRHA